MPRVPKSREWMLSHGLNAMTTEERREAARRGGLKAQENLRRRRNMTEIAKQVLAMELQGNEETRQALRQGGMEREDINYAAGIIMVQTQKALSGDTKAAEFVRDTSGNKPSDALMVGNLDDKPFEVIDLGGLSDAELKEMLANRVLDEIANEYGEEEDEPEETEE